VAAPPLGARLEQPLLLDAAAIKAGARLVGDMNPLHHDEAVAAASRYGELIASGAHTAALLAGMLGSGFGDEGRDGRGQVGVDYSVQFRRPVRVGRPMRMEWLVTALEPRRSGTIVRMEGGIVDMADDGMALTAKLTALYFT
jgi:acyl dehydratase